MPLCFARLASVFVKEGEGVEIRLSLLQGFWENMLHLSALFQSRLVENRKPFGARATFFLSQTKNQSQPNDFSFG